MKVVFIILLTLFSIEIYSQIKPYASVDIGYEDRYVYIYDLKYPNYAEFRNTIITGINTSLQYKKFQLFTNIKTLTRPNSIFNYEPLQVEYRIGFDYNINIFNLRYDHVCSHSIDKQYFNEGLDRVVLRINLLR